MHSDAEVDPRVVAFTAGLTPIAIESGTWPSGHKFELTSYLTDLLPPLDLVTSVRAIVTREGAVLAFDDDWGTHIIPGGRVDPGESLRETLARERREEIGCEVAGAGGVGLHAFPSHRPPGRRHTATSTRTTFTSCIRSGHRATASNARASRSSGRPGSFPSREWLA